MKLNIGNEPVVIGMSLGRYDYNITVEQLG